MLSLLHSTHQQHHTHTYANICCINASQSADRQTSRSCQRQAGGIKHLQLFDLGLPAVGHALSQSMLFLHSSRQKPRRCKDASGVAWHCSCFNLSPASKGHPLNKGVVTAHHVPQGLASHAKELGLPAVEGAEQASACHQGPARR